MASNNAINSPLLGNLPGAVPIASGGTGSTSIAAGLVLSNGSVLSTTGSLTTHGLLVGAGTSAPGALSVGTNGQLVIGSTGADPVFASLGTDVGSGLTATTGAGSLALALNLTAGTGITLTPSLVDTSIEVSATPVAETYTVVSGTSQTMAVGAAYLAVNASQTTFTLPATAAQGTVMKIASAGANAAGWTIAQASGQSVQIGNASSTPGASGSVSSTSSNGGDGVVLVCTVANTTWVAQSTMGSLNIV